MSTGGTLSVLFEDNHLLAVDKPAGLLTQAARAGDDNLLDRAREYIRERYDKPGKVYLGLVHRLDRNVSGVVLFARTSKAASRLSDAFRRRDVHKRYLGIVLGAPPERGTLEHRLGPRPEGARGVCQRPDGKAARLDFERLATGPVASLLAITLHTGRKHQIRAQLSLAGWPLLGDPLYGTPDDRLRRPALHARLLQLVHPVRKAPITLLSPVPEDLLRAAETLPWDKEISRKWVGCLLAPDPSGTAVQ